MEFLNHPGAVMLLNAYATTRRAHSWQTRPRPFASLSCRTSGSCTFYAGGGACTVSAPDTVYIPPDVAYAQTASDEAYCVLHFSIPPTPDRDIVRVPRAFGNNARAFEEIRAAFGEGTAEGRFRAQALFFHLLARLCAFYDEKKDPRIAQALRYMQSRLDDPTLTVEDVAAQVYVSSVFLRKLFKEQLGCSPVRKLLRLRMEAARRLLIDEDMPIQSIAAQCGFSEAKYFSKVFHDETGMTARQYREMHR
jgi:AraC-like DNA-binding protein